MSTSTDSPLRSDLWRAWARHFTGNSASGQCARWRTRRAQTLAESDLGGATDARWGAGFDGSFEATVAGWLPKGRQRSSSRENDRFWNTAELRFSDEFLILSATRTPLFRFRVRAASCYPDSGWHPRCQPTSDAEYLDVRAEWHREVEGPDLPRVGTSGDFETLLAEDA